MSRMLAILVIAIVGCQKAPPTETPQQQPSPAATTDNISDATKAKAIAAKKALFGKLSSRLKQVVTSDGPGAAIDVCSKEAAAFAASVGDEQGVKIGRTALKLRNSQNVPPSWANPLIRGDATEPQFVTINATSVGALLPIKLKAACVACHGPADSLAPAVKDRLLTHYPQDRATGFQEGDLRGWFWVEVPRS